jgi:hypothetical protein
MAKRPEDDVPPAGRLAETAWSQDAYAPLATEGPVVEALRAKLADIAVELGYPPQVEQRVEVGAVGFHRVLLQPYVTIVRLVSPTFHVEGDERRLGVALGEIQLDGEVVPFEDLRLQQGFHDIEQNRSLRWTDGDAFLVLEPMSSERVLRLRVVSAAPS